MSEIKLPQIIIGINDSFTWGQRETIFAEFSLINGCNFCYETHTILAKMFERHTITDTIRKEIHSLMSDNHIQNKNISDDVYQNLIKIKECATYVNSKASNLIIPKEISEQMELIYNDGYYYPEETR